MKPFVFVLTAIVCLLLGRYVGMTDRSEWSRVLAPRATRIDLDGSYLRKHGHHYLILHLRGQAKDPMVIMFDPPQELALEKDGMALENVKMVTYFSGGLPGIILPGAFDEEKKQPAPGAAALPGNVKFQLPGNTMFQVAANHAIHVPANTTIQTPPPEPPKAARAVDECHPAADAGHL